MKFKICLIFVFIYSNLVSGQPFNYPDSRKSEQRDSYHGTIVEDPYRWLEDDHSAETAEWVQNQNTVTFNYLKGISFRDKLKTRLTSLWNYPRQSAPNFQSGYYYYNKNNGKQNQSVLYRRKGIKGLEELVLDPNFMSEDGTTSIKLYKVSNDGKYAAYGISKAGSDWTTIKVMESATGRELSETLNWVKFSGIEWEGNGFYYSRYDEPSKEIAFSGKNEFHKIFYHTVGTPQSKDQLIYEDSKNSLRNFSASVSSDESFLFIASTQSTSGNDLIVRKTGDRINEFKRIADGFKSTWRVIDNTGSKILLLTNENAPRNKIVDYDFESGRLQTIIAEQNEVLLNVIRSNNYLVCNFMKDASSRLIVYSLKGEFEKEIKLPTYCTVSDLNGDKKDSLLFFAVSSFTFPETIYKYSFISGVQSSYFTPMVDFNVNEYETQQVFYQSKDGTKIPMFIVMKKGRIKDGTNPLLLFGYGGFNISKTPEFITERMVFLENGGIFALPNIRGGGEYGEEWHKAGTKTQKQNVFDDFISAAEFLIKEKYTAASRLAIGGRSNGGLLVGAVMTQRPDLFKVALPAVGVMDMLRFHKFTIGWAWTGDFGSSEDIEQFKALYSYSPLHNIRKAIHYPATLVTTADHDDRVVPAHSFKFISTLQENNSGSNPVMIRIDVNAGHGSGKPVSKQIEEQTDVFSFLMYNLEMKVIY
ncbi:MAG: S9 family peptidase [Bacteroidetes bacterium]|nr:S9 family peptidase [Bacteroidota bacterium]